MTTSRAKIRSTESLGSTRVKTTKTIDRSRFLYRKGRWVYGRFKNGSLKPLPPEDSPNFPTAYDEFVLERNAPKAKPNDRRPRVLPDCSKVVFGPGTVGRLILAYRSELRSPFFTELGEGTRYNYGKALDLMRSILGGGLFADMDQEGVEDYVAKINDKHGPTTADLHKNLISNLYDFTKGKREYRRKGMVNPTIGVEKHYVADRSKLTKPWPDDVQEWFVATAKRPLQDGYHLMRFTGQRGGDATVVKWTDLREAEVERDGKWVDVWQMRIVQEKTGEPVWHELPTILADYLEVMRKRIDPDVAAERNPEGYVLTSTWGKPWANATTLSHAIRRHFDKFGKKRHKMHGLRATVACEILSMDGGTIEAVKSITGHLSDRVARDYAREFDQKRVNARTVGMWNKEIGRKKVTKVGKRRAAIKVVS